MVEISCYYVHYNRNPINFTFVKYEKFMKIIFQQRVICIALENLQNDEVLYGVYILSLLCTEDTSKINYTWNERNRKRVYSISTEKTWKNRSFYGKYDFITLEKNCFKNPLLSQEPTKETSLKKQNKLLKLMYNHYENGYFSNPYDLINIYQEILLKRTNMQQVIEYEKNIYILCCIRGFSRDIYANIMRFM